MGVSTFSGELRECLREIVGTDVPAPPDDVDDPQRFFGQWLAERNLGLVPIEGAGTFDWPGSWIAIVPGTGRRHAVVMFGSPPGVWLDPSSAYREGIPIEAGLMVTPLDLRLATDTPYGSVNGVGTVVAVLVASHAEAPLRRVDSVPALPGRGLAGDRYAEGRGTFSAPGRGYELTLVEARVLDTIQLSWEDARRNIVTTGISLNGLVGKRFRVGSVTCVGRRLAEPCAHLERLARPGLLRPLVHRGGLRADILSPGTIALGDDVTVAD